MSEDRTVRVGIIMNGVTGRMGTNQHLLRSMVPIIKQGGVRLADGRCAIPDPILVGRNEGKLRDLATQSGIQKWTTDLDTVLGDPDYTIYFDAQTTERRPEAVTKAAAAGKHLYCEKPTALDTATAYEVYRTARDAQVKHGVVQDKLWLPGLIKLKTLIDSGFFGRIISVRAEFGYWVFEGFNASPQRPSWNYRKEDGGGIVMDMFCHWHYVLDNLFGSIRRVLCRVQTQIPERVDEKGNVYACTAEDAAYSLFELKDGLIAQFYSSWCVRVNRESLFSIQVDGTAGSAVAGLRDCKVQSVAITPMAIWNPDVDDPNDYLADWQRVPARQVFDNAFKAQWELFIRHVVEDIPFPWTLLEAAKGVQLAEIGLESSRKNTWLAVPDLVP